MIDRIKDVTLKDFMIDMDLELRESQSKNFRYFALDLKKYSLEL